MAFPNKYDQGAQRGSERRSRSAAHHILPLSVMAALAAPTIVWAQVQAPSAPASTQQTLTPNSTQPAPNSGPPQSDTPTPPDAPLSTGAAQQSLVPATGQAPAGPVTPQPAPPQVAGSLPESAYGSYFDRNNNVSVLQRLHPGYDPLGIDLGGFILTSTTNFLPSYVDNVFASTTDKQADGVLDLTESFAARSRWLRNELDITATSASSFYWRNSSQNITNYTVGANGRWDLFNQSSLSAGLGYADTSLPRTSNFSILGTETPVRYGTISANIGAVQTLNRVRISENASYQNANYTNNTTTSGVALDLHYLDDEIISYGARADYAITQAFSFFMAAQGNQRTYDNTALVLNRNSSGYQANGGADFDITRLVRGNIQIGYLAQIYVIEPPFHTVSGFSAHANVEYFPTSLLTLTLKFDRQVNDQTDPTAISALETKGSIQADYELLRQVILTTSLAYETDDFAGVQRLDRRTSYLFGGTYLLNEHVGLIASYTYLDQHSSGAARTDSFAVSVVSVGISFKL